LTLHEKKNANDPFSFFYKVLQLDELLS